MIKIGIIIDDITKSAGTERAVTSLVNGLMKFYPSEYQISILSVFSNSKTPIFFEIDPKVEIIHLNKKNDFNALTKVFWYKALISDLKSLNEKKNYQVLLGTTYIHNILLGFITKNSNTKSIGCEHEVYDYPPKLIQQIRKIMYPKLDQLVVLNETEKQRYTFSKRISIIPNSNPITTEKKADLNSRRIISVGRLTHQKGFDMLIEAAEIIHQKYPEWEFHIFGTGEDQQQLNEEIQTKNLTETVFLRGLTQNIESEYLNSSMFVLTSRWESFGLVLIEAMTLGLPVVSFACDGPKNIVKNQENGYLIPKENVPQLAEGIEKLIENEDLRKKMGENSIVLSESYNEKNIIPLWNQLVQSIL